MSRLEDGSSIVPRDSDSNRNRPDRISARNGLPSRCFLDSVTTCKGKGIYGVKVLFGFVEVAEYYVVKGFAKKSYWSVLNSESEPATNQHFKSLNAATNYCVEKSI